MKNTPQHLALLITVIAVLVTRQLFAEPPDLTQSNTGDHALTYNLGPTGLRGWIYTHAASNLDGLQGRTTTASRQILVTHVGTNSPAAGVMEVNDVILGVGDTPFSDDARKSFGRALTEAEKSGVLKLIRFRAGKTEKVQLKMRVMGSYSATAPYDCPKSKLILAEACRVLAKEPLEENLWGAINALALLSTGNPDYLPKVQAFARTLAPPTLKLELKSGMVLWDWGYKNLFLCEYYLMTGDKDVLHGITEYTVALAKGQGMYGTFGHGISELTEDGKLHGPVPPYGPMNQAGLIGNLSIIMGKKCGVKDPEIEPAIARGTKFIAYYVDKGSLPYGEHEPWPYHENNGKVSSSAVLFSLLDNRVKETQFFAKMAVAGYKNRECGHTGQGFSYLWGALGANVGGPAASAAFFKEASWHLDLVRRCDGSFTYDGGEQYGAGRTDDNTYYGKSSYNGLSPNATYVLTYSTPLHKLFITGKDARKANCLGKQDVAGAISSGCFDLDRAQKTPQQLVATFKDWSPIVRGWAAEELSRRPEVKAMVPQLLTLAESKDVHVSQGACETLGYLNCAEALPVFVRLLSHDDRWLRYKAAQAIRKMGGTAKPAIPDILKAIVKTAEPLQPIVWADPIQFTHGQLAAALFAGGLTDAVAETDRTLLYPAIKIISQNADGMARTTLRGFFENKLTLADVQALAPELLAAVEKPCPADTMFGWEIRMGAFNALSKYNFKEAIQAGIIFAKNQGGHGSESRTGVIMTKIAAYGTAARDAIPGLKGVIVALNDQCKRGEYPAGELNDRRVKAVEEAIKAIEAATTQPELRSVAALSPQRATKRK